MEMSEWRFYEPYVYYLNGCKFPLSLSLSLSIFPPPPPTSFLDRSLLYLNILTESLGDVISSDSHYDNQEVIHWLAESLELVFGCLRTRREACRLAEKEAGPANDINLVPRSAFQSFKSFILNCVEFLDIILRVSQQKNVTTLFH